MLEMLIIGGVALVIINLVVRDQTEFRIRQLRSELMALRSEEKRLSELRDEVELMVAQIGDAIICHVPCSDGIPGLIIGCVTLDSGHRCLARKVVERMGEIGPALENVDLSC